MTGRDSGQRLGRTTDVSTSDVDAGVKQAAADMS
jgi:hypothetical protein